jgi:hypothetical protein
MKVLTTKSINLPQADDKPAQLALRIELEAGCITAAEHLAIQ